MLNVLLSPLILNNVGHFCFKKTCFKKLSKGWYFLERVFFFFLKRIFRYSCVVFLKRLFLFAFSFLKMFLPLFFDPEDIFSDPKDFFF